MGRATTLYLAGILLVPISIHGADQRILFNNERFELGIDPYFECGDVAQLILRSDDPVLFETQSSELQRIVDGAQAALSYECPELSVMEIEGQLSGLPDPVYRGIAERRSNWTLGTSTSIESAAYERSEDLSESGAGNGETEFNVANLSAGMSVAEAREAASSTFGVDPDYDDESGVLTLRAGGCPEDYDWSELSPSPQAGWKCLTAWFTDRRVARLYLLDLVQVVESTDLQNIQQQLVERFGEPLIKERQKREQSWWQDSADIHSMAWGQTVGTENAEASNGQAYTLQAKIVPMEQATVVAVTLYHPEDAPQPEQNAPEIPGLTL